MPSPIPTDPNLASRELDALKALQETAREEISSKFSAIVSDVSDMLTNIRTETQNLKEDMVHLSNKVDHQLPPQA